MAKVLGINLMSPPDTDMTQSVQKPSSKLPFLTKPFNFQFAVLIDCFSKSFLLSMSVDNRDVTCNSLLTFILNLFYSVHFTP